MQRISFTYTHDKIDNLMPMLQVIITADKDTFFEHTHNKWSALETEYYEYNINHTFNYSIILYNILYNNIL